MVNLVIEYLIIPDFYECRRSAHEFIQKTIFDMSSPMGRFEENVV
jgi:hypothetical protein